MNKEFAMVGLLVKLKPGSIKKDYMINNGLFTEGKVYKIKSFKGARATVLDPETNKICGDAKFSNLEMTSRTDLADTINEQANEMIEKAKLLLQKSERLKKFDSDEEEIASIIWGCIEQEMTPKQIVSYLSGKNIIIKFKE